MAEAELVAVYVNSSDLYKTGHMANRWFHGLMLHFEEGVISKAPVRSGELAGSISTDVFSSGAAHQMLGTLEIGAEHALYVLRGTTGPIMSRGLWAAGGDPESAFIRLWGSEDPVTKKFTKHRIAGVRRKQHRVRVKGRFMKVRPYPHSFYTKSTYRVTVNGQEANNFLLKGWLVAARRHRAMHDVPGFILHP